MGVHNRVGTEQAAEEKMQGWNIIGFGVLKNGEWGPRRSLSGEVGALPQLDSSCQDDQCAQERHIEE